ncbi:DUF2786 domain-containing protein [Actinopolymorpha sp. B9G3]|uniref:DUF2786 domain-containing protein n=1 Tax=Actinopolymorpha sp. B9G3 TaxID=3158970 RepID=UPI0032D90707
MGRNSRDRRAAKQRARRRRSGRASGEGTSPFGDPLCDCPHCRADLRPDEFGAAGLGSVRAMSPGATPTPEEIERWVLAAAYSGRDNAEISRRVATDLAAPGVEARLVDTVIGSCLLRGVRGMWEGGWQPRDAAELASRRLDPLQRDYLTDVILGETQRYAESTIDPRWRAQLDELGGSLWWRSDQPHLDQWRTRQGRDRSTALQTAMTVLGFCLTLPRTTKILPLPGEASVRSERPGRGEVDDKVLARIRALLAKAESTEFPDEAEALSSKAQELMTKFSLDRALLDADVDGAGRTPGTGSASARRIWLDAPYVSAKSLLVHVVATANRSRTVVEDKTGYVIVVGEEVDLELVEILTTSLLLQANRAMLAHGSQVSRFGRSSTRSWRQSFLVSYSSRIGERLNEANAASQATVDAGSSGRLLPVLAAREQEVEALFGELFPRTRARSVSVSNAAGWAAGKVAADLASLDGRSSLTG